MTILNVLDALDVVQRERRRLDAVSRFAADAERTFAEFARTVDIPAVMRMKEELQPKIDLARRMQREVAAALPSEETLAKFQASFPIGDALAKFQASFPTRDAHAEFQTTHRDAQRQVHEAMRTALPDTQGMLERMRSMFEPSRHLVEQFAAMQVPARELVEFAGRVEASWLHTAQQMVERARIVERQIDRQLARLLLARGWLGVERHLTTWELSRLLDVRGPNKAVTIDRFICAAFRRKKHARVASMTKAWWRVPFLKDRQTTIRQALRAHRRKEYALSIATLLPLVDGLTSTTKSCVS
jgi:hypothetical protein